MFRCFRWLPISILLAICGGCASCDSAPPYACGSGTPQLACREVEPQVVSPNVSLLPERLPPTQEPDRYCALTECEAQCLAAKNSQSGNLLVQEAAAVEATRKCFDRGSELASQLLLLEARQKRNEDAAVALEVFMRIVEAEGGAQNIQLRMKEVDAMFADVGRLQERGMLAPISKNEIESQRLEILHRQADVQGTIDRLNHQLAGLMGVDLPPGSRYWPETDLTVQPELPDREAAVQMAFTNRQDLKALRIAANADDRETLAAARVLLAPLGMGSSAASPGCLMKLLLCSQGAEADSRAQQLRIAYRDRQQAIRSETLQALDDMQTRLTQSAVTRDRLQNSHAKLSSIEAQQQAMAGAAFTIRKTRLEGIAIEQDLLHDAIEWKLAAIKLRAAQGLLGKECGY